MCEGPRLLRRALGLRAPHLRSRAGRRGAHDRGLHPRLLPPGTGPVPRGHRDEAVASDAEEPQAAQAPRALSGGQREALLQARPRTARGQVAPGHRSVTAGEVYLTAEQLAVRAGELGAEIAREYDGRDLLLVVPLRGCVVFAADLSRCIRVPHELDFV